MMADYGWTLERDPYAEHSRSSKKHVHPLILVYYVFPQLVKYVLIQYLIDHLCMLLRHCGMPLI